MLSVKELDQKEVELCFDLDSNTMGLWTKKQWESEFSKKGVKIVGLILRNKIIGIYVVQIIIDEAHINFFAIRQKYRGKGYGSYLMSYLIKHCKKLSVKRLLLEVSESNSIAEVFYGKYNFLSVGRRKRYYHDGSDAVMKEKNLYNN